VPTSQLLILRNGNEVARYLHIRILTYAVLIGIDVKQPRAANWDHWFWFMRCHPCRLRPGGNRHHIRMAVLSVKFPAPWHWFMR